MIILIEGVDGSGKSTLCKQLKERGYETYTIQSNVEELNEWIDLIRKYDSGTVIMDRASFISDLVYRLTDGKARRGMTLLGIATVLSSNVKIIHCQSATAFNDATERGEDNITDRVTHHLIEINYDMVMRMFSLFTDTPIMDYNWKIDDISDVIKFIERR